MGRTLAILKYVPAVLCGLLVVAWAASLFLSVSMVHGNLRIMASNGTIAIFHQVTSLWRPFQTFWQPTPFQLENCWGAAYLSPYNTIDYHEISFPMPFLFSILLPIAVGCFIRFRFPLWSYFAWTALIAVESTFYLR